MLKTYLRKHLIGKGMTKFYTVNDYEYIVIFLKNGNAFYYSNIMNTELITLNQ